jgi:hypothetical protein
MRPEDLTTRRNDKGPDRIRVNTESDVVVRLQWENETES